MVMNPKLEVNIMYESEYKNRNYSFSLVEEIIGFSSATSKYSVTLSKARVFKAGGFRHGYGYGYGTIEFDDKPEINLTELDNTTVDLTELIGRNAMIVSETNLTPGKYTKIELYVEEVNATLNNSENNIYADVKVPSGKLMITKFFEINSGETTSFVFDINVVQKGNKEEYNLHPVISESGVVGKDLKHNQVNILNN